MGTLGGLALVWTGDGGCFQLVRLVRLASSLVTIDKSGKVPSSSRRAVISFGTFGKAMPITRVSDVREPRAWTRAHSPKAVFQYSSMSLGSGRECSEDITTAR